MNDFRRKPAKVAESDCRPIERMSRWEYHLLTVQDEIEYAPLQRLNAHRFVCLELAKQLAALLFIPTPDFFGLLQTQEALEQADAKEKDNLQEGSQLKFRLRACLQSCLEVFSRTAYLTFGKLSGNTQEKVKMEPYWGKVKQIVLMVLLRISTGTSSEEKIIIMNGWYLDCCKLLDICLIYGGQYKNAVRQLIRNVLTKGAELEDFQKDFEKVLELSYLRLKELCEEYEGFAEIDFARLRETAHLYQNFHNAESTLTKSLLKTLFSTYDLIRNLEAILQFFPSRCRVQLLEHSLIIKRLIMIYNKLRYHDDCVWRFGPKESLFRPLLDFLKTAIISFLSHALTKVAQLLSGLPFQSPFRTDLKRAYANFWFFTFTTPAVSYEQREDKRRLEKASYHGRELATEVIQQKGQELLLRQLFGQFSREAKSFPALMTAINILKSKGETEKRRKALERAEKWRLPSFSDFVQANYPKPPSPSQHLTDLRFQKEYEDEPAFTDNQDQMDYPNMDSCEISYYCESFDKQEDTGENSRTIEKTAHTIQKTLIEKKREEVIEMLDELDYSSIGNNSQHYCSQALSDSVDQTDSLVSVDALLQAT